MIQRILLVAGREFRQIAATRSFWLTLLILPIAVALGPIATRYMDRSETERLMLIDRAGGGTARAVAERLGLDEERRTMAALGRYVGRHGLERAAPGAAWVSRDRWLGDADVRAFERAGGLDAARAAIDRMKPSEVPAFKAPEPLVELVPAPAAVVAAPEAELDRALRPLLEAKERPLTYALLIPEGFGRTPGVRLWSDGPPAAALVQTLQGVLGRELQARFLAANGVAPAIGTSAAGLTPAIAVETPTRDNARQRVLVRSILPLACAYVLLMSLMLSGSWMLQGSVEERGNKLIEAMLACVSPSELMYGKLVGTVAIGLSMVLTWVACGLFAAYATHGAIADLIRPALAPVATAGAVATIVYFFVAGYVMVSMIFLAIGATCDSMREAQGYLMPVVLAIMLPVLLLVQATLRGAGGIGVEVLTWIPLWTPFAVLARLGGGMPGWQVVATGALLALFVTAELVLLGRVFRASLLGAGSRPGVVALLTMMRRPD